jgi:hypothetical protein
MLDTLDRALTATIWSLSPAALLWMLSLWLPLALAALLLALGLWAGWLVLRVPRRSGKSGAGASRWPRR